MSLSIITAVFNSAKTLSQCITSVKNQSVSVEHIVVDGASTDNTLETIHEFQDHISKFISEPDKGIYDALNKGLSMATGDIVGILHADDFYPTSDVLEKVLEVFEDPAVEACYGDLLYVDSHKPSKVIRTWHSGAFDVNKFYWGWMPPHPTFFVRRSVYEKFGGFRLDLGTAADYELMLRLLLKQGVKTRYIPKVLVHMRAGGASNASILRRLKANVMDRKAWQVNGLQPHVWTLWIKPLRKLGQWF